MLDDGQAQAGASRFPGPAFVHPVEPLKDPVLGILGDADAVVLHHEHRFSGGFLDGDLDKASLPVVADGVLDQILHKLLQHFPVPGDAGLPAKALQPDPPALCLDQHGLADLPGQGKELYALDLPGPVRVIQLGELKNVVDEAQKSRRVLPDLPGEVNLLILVHHPVLDELGVAGDGGERGFQLMGYVGGEVLAALGGGQDLFVLGADLMGKGLQLPVDGDAARLVQVLRHLVDGGNELSGEQMTQQQAGPEYHQRDEHHHRPRRQKDAAHASGLGGQAQHRTVRQTQGIVEGVHIEGIGPADCLSGALGQGLPNLRPVGVVGKAGRLCLVVIEDCAVLRHPGDPQVPGGQADLLPLGKDLRGGEHLGVDPQVLADLLLEQVVVDPGDPQGGKHQGNQGNQGQMQIDLLLHRVSSGALCNT